MAIFRMTHRVEFADTDMAGIMHFASYFRLMEVTEHAFWRSLGLSVHMEEEGRTLSFPRVRASCEYRRPLRFEEEVEVLLSIAELRARSLRYRFDFVRPDSGEECAAGEITAVCVTVSPDGMKAAPIPERIRALIEGAGDVR